jgi:hypothetical protein
VLFLCKEQKSIIPIVFLMVPSTIRDAPCTTRNMTVFFTINITTSACDEESIGKSDKSLECMKRNKTKQPHRCGRETGSAPTTDPERTSVIPHL